jgi:hypothetical protein
MKLGKRIEYLLTNPSCLNQIMDLLERENQDSLIVIRIENDPNAYERYGYWIGFCDKSSKSLEMYDVDEMKFKKYLSECENYLEDCVLGIDYNMKCSRIAYGKVLKERENSHF